MKTPYCDRCGGECVETIRSNNSDYLDLETRALLLGGAIGFVGALVLVAVFLALKP